jgi:hypothetical protein
MLIPIQFIDSEDTEPESLFGRYPQQIFREDSYDPITRIRRGRVYRSPNQKHSWHVQDPSRTDLKDQNWAGGSAKTTEAMVYQKASLGELDQKPHLKVRLGDANSSNIWKVILKESSVFGSQILTLKSYRSFGEIPELNPTIIPPDVLHVLSEDLERVERSANRMSPDDVVDRCRNALSIIYGALAGDRTKDLDKAIQAYLSKFKKHDFMSNAGYMVNRLHSRGKACEQHSKELRPLSEEDAQLALRCLGFVLIESGWGIPTH